MPGCSKDKNPTKPPVGDVTTPAAIVDLAVVGSTGSKVVLTWTATGDDSLIGTASEYDIRYSVSPITEANWGTATQVAGEPEPKVAGSTETFVTTGLSASTGYFFALKVADERANWSGLSNVVTDSTTAGPAWLPLGSGMNGGVNALAVYNGQLIAGGWFTTAGGVSANCIAAWNGSSWSPLGSGMDGGVCALAVFDGQLIAGGWFTTAGGVSANGIAAWNGSSWSPLGSGMDYYYVRALTVFDGQLMAGGAFTTAGGVSANHIAAWNGSSWSPLGSGTDGQVYAVAVYNGQLIAGGEFTTAGGVSANGIATWNGSSWSPLGSGMDYYWGYVSALAVYNGQLIAGGEFTSAGGVPAKNIAAWSD